MKSAVLGLSAFIGGMVLFIGISTVFEYVSVHNAMSFALRNGIHQASKVAMIPDIVCELVENPEYNPLLKEEDIEEFIEVCVEVYMTAEEYFSELYRAVGGYRQGNMESRLELFAYEPKPFLARAKLITKVHSNFWKTEIEVEEMVIAH